MVKYRIWHKASDSDPPEVIEEEFYSLTAAMRVYDALAAHPDEAPGELWIERFQRIGGPDYGG